MSSKFSIRKDNAESLTTIDKSLGITARGKVSLNAEKENENPKTIWKNQMLSREASCKLGESGSNKPKIPNDGEKEVSLQDVCDEVADLRSEIRQILLNRDRESKILMSKILKQLEDLSQRPICSCGSHANGDENDSKKAEMIARSEQSTLALLGIKVCVHNY